MLATPSPPELGALYPVVPLLVKPGSGPKHTVGGVEQGGFLLVVLGGS